MPVLRPLGRGVEGQAAAEREAARLPAAREPHEPRRPVAVGQRQDGVGRPEVDAEAVHGASVRGGAPCSETVAVPEAGRDNPPLTREARGRRAASSPSLLRELHQRPVVGADGGHLQDPARPRRPAGRSAPAWSRPSRIGPITSAPPSDLDQLGGDRGRVDGRHDQHIGRAGQAHERIVAARAPGPAPAPAASRPRTRSRCRPSRPAWPPPARTRSERSPIGLPKVE